MVSARTQIGLIGLIYADFGANLPQKSVNISPISPICVLSVHVRDEPLTMESSEKGARQRAVSGS